MLPLPTPPPPFRTKSPPGPSPTFQKSPPLPLRLFSIPPITSTAPQSTPHTSRKTQMVRENLVSIPPLQRTLLCMKPPSHQNPTSMTTKTLFSLPQPMPLSSLGVVWRLFKVSLASATTDRIPMARIIRRPALSPQTYQLSLKPKKTSMPESSVWLYQKVWSFFCLWPIPFVLYSFCHTGSVSSDSDTDSTVTEGPYSGQDSAPDATSSAMQRYYAMMSSRPPVSEDRRILPPPVQSQPQNSIIAPRGPPGIARQSAPVQRRQQDIQTPLPRDSLVLPPAAPMQRRDSGYAGRPVIPRRPSLEREQRTILPPGLSTSPGHSSITGQPSAPPAYTPGRPRRDSLTQQARRDSVSAAPQGPIQPGRRDSFSAPQPPPQSVHRNSVSAVPLPVRRATDPLPASNPSPVSARRSSDSAPRGQVLLVSTRVRFNDENLICPSPIPMHERRRGWHNRRGYVFLNLRL